MVHLVVLDRLLRATTKKVVNFFEEKVHPRQNPGYAYGKYLCASNALRSRDCLSVWGKNRKNCFTVNPKSYSVTFDPESYFRVFVYSTYHV